MLKKILKDFSIYGVMPYFPKFGYFLIMPLITPFLTKYDFGVYGLVFSYVAFFEMFLTLCLSVNLSNSFIKSKGQYKWLWNQIYGFLFIWSFIFVGLLVLLLSFVVDDVPFENKVKIIFLVSVPYLIFSSSKEIGINYCRLNRKPFAIMIRSSVFGILSIVILFVMVRYFKAGYMGWFWAYFVVQVLENISWYVYVVKTKKIYPIFRFKRKTIYKSLKVSLPILPHINALYMLNQSDRIVMDASKVSTGDIGLYSGAYSLSSIIATVTNAYLQAITPYALDLLNKKKEEVLKRIVFGSQFVFYLMAVFFSLFAEEICTFQFRNNDFNGITGLFVLLAISSIFKPMYMASTLYYSYYEKTKFFGVHSFIAGILNIVLNIIFIPIYGIEAAAATTIIGFLYLSFSRFWDPSFKELTATNFQPFLWLLSGIVICVICYYLSLESFEFRMTVFAVLVLIIIAAFLLFKNALKSLLKYEA